MKIVGQVSTPEERDEIELITRIFIVGNRARHLGLSIHEISSSQRKKKI